MDKRNTLPIHNALTSTALGDALDGAKSDPKDIARRLHVNWGHASDQQLKRTMAEADCKAGGLVPLVDGVARECEIRRAFDAAPAIPVAGTSQASSLNEKVQVDLLFLGDLIAFHVLGLFSRYSLLVPVRSTNPGAVFGEPRMIQMAEGGEWENDLWVDFAPIATSNCNIKGRVRVPGFRNDGMGWRAGFTIV